jgi:hypothetical protein
LRLLFAIRIRRGWSEPEFIYTFTASRSRAKTQRRKEMLSAFLSPLASCLRPVVSHRVRRTRKSVRSSAFRRVFEKPH